jgi:chemotaxis protein histidine kinase CheA
MDELLREFLTETSEGISVLDVELVKLERTPDDPSLLGNIFRLVHTIKGTCGFLGLPRLERLAHAAETVLGKIRDGELAATPEAVTLILESLDGIKAILAALESSEAEPAGSDAVRQEGVIETRMRPIGSAWARLPRIARELARELGKKIELRMLGAETELDRQVLEMIRDPLTHMVRNSGDHGIEGPAERIAKGKPESGTITIEAFHRGGHIVIEIGDDGRGLDTDKIKRKVLSMGLASEAELAAMSEPQIQQFILKPGFSTASQVTSVSGRGVGMDVVRANIAKIGGSLEIKSRSGEGSAFTIKIPLTPAIVSADRSQFRGAA